LLDAGRIQIQRSSQSSGNYWIAGVPPAEHDVLFFKASGLTGCGTHPNPAIKPIQRKLLDCRRPACRARRALFQGLWPYWMLDASKSSDQANPAETIGLQASRLQSTGRALFQGLWPYWMLDASKSSDQANPAETTGLQASRLHWRKLLDCRRLACRARDVLFFKASGLTGCGTHPNPAIKPIQRSSQSGK
ncbi:MAG: hypothetical protein WC944_10720, partial [Candidatus Cloacimonadaceae bacterium]